MTGPIDTIREALNTHSEWDALAALTEVEHQLADWNAMYGRLDVKRRAAEQQLAAWEKAGYAESETVAAVLARAGAAETALAEAQVKWVAAERRANALADALRQIAVLLEEATGVTNASTDNQPLNIARAALDQQEQP